MKISQLNIRQKRSSARVFSVAWLSVHLTLAGCTTKIDDPLGETVTTTGNQALPSGSDPGVTQPGTKAPKGPAASEAPDPFVCSDGDQRGCAETPEGQNIEFPTKVPQGRCSLGEQSCSNNAWGPCEGAIAPLAEDRCDIPGDDSDCDGSPNEGCDCVSGTPDRACGESDVGSCKLGTQACVDGSWGECNGDKGPTPELCDGNEIDEDCDGLADLNDPDCNCLSESTRPCETGLAGDCALGVKTCVDGKFGKCVQRFDRLENESCLAPRKDDLGQAPGDEDCDGTVDRAMPRAEPPTGCELFSFDRDGDGFGAMGSSFQSGEPDYTHGCFCKGMLPDPALKPTTAKRVNSDCGDCSEDGHHVNPKAIVYHEEPSACLKAVRWRGGEFDYNCNGKQDLRHTGVGECIEVDGACESNGGYWASSVPLCGESGKGWTGCLVDTPPCDFYEGNDVAVLIKQTCR